MVLCCAINMNLKSIFYFYLYIFTYTPMVPEYYLIVADLRRNFAAWVAVTVDKRMRFLDEAAP